MPDSSDDAAIKVPAVTLLFWILKILATTLGETGGDAVSMSAGLGYLAATAIFFAVFVGVVTAQIRARRFSAPLYWLTIVATTTVGTTLADFADRSLNIGYASGASLLLALLLLSLATWYRVQGSVSVISVASPRTETFYWATILFSQTLGTALGDWTADTAGIGYAGGAWVFAAALCVVALAYFCTRLSRTALFWIAFVLTRPLGAVLGDLLDKPLSEGGFALSRVAASVVLAIVIVALVAAIPQRPAERAH